MSKPASSYYPPRARWYAPLLNLGYLGRRRLGLDRLQMPTGLSFRGVICGLLVPGLAVWVRGPRIWGRLAVSLCAVLVFVFLAFLGYTVGNLAFGLLLSVHVTGLLYLCGPWLEAKTVGSRFWWSLGLLFVLAALFYLPARSFLQDHLFMPLRVRGHVVVVSKLASMATAKRGDWVAYTVGRWDSREAYFEHNGVVVQAGYGFGPVIGVAGDRVRFAPDSVEVNGVALPRRPLMPSSGEVVVPEKHWLVWPEFDTSGHGFIAQEQIEATLLRTATITADQMVGRPFKHWFWRRQNLS